jgi:hypothetical protein
MWVTITDVVPMMTEPRVGPSAPVPTADVIESIVPGTTGSPAATPSSSAADVVTSPITPRIGTSGASLSGRNPAKATSSGSYSTAPHVRLSQASCPNTVDCVADTRPVRRASGSPSARRAPRLPRTTRGGTSRARGRGRRCRCRSAAGSARAARRTCRTHRRPSRLRLCAAPRVSIQRMQGPVGRPSAATGTVLMYWLVTATPTRGGTGESEPRVVRVAVTTADHICSGSCSAPPPATKVVATGCDDQARV